MAQVKDVDLPLENTPERQIPKVKIHKSTERRVLTPVFGTSCPPKGLSGKLRDLAYQFSEGRLSHWMILLLADRVDVIENGLGGILLGKPDRLIKEMGLRAEWKRHELRADLRRLRNELLFVAGAGAVVWS